MVVHARYPVGEPRVQRQAAAALDAGYEVDVVCLRHAGELGEQTVDGARVYRLPVSHDRGAGVAGMAVEYLLFVALALGRVARLHGRRRYRVVHVSNPPDLLILAGLLPRWLGARLLFDVHDLTPDLFEWRFGASRWRGLARRLLVAQERLACRLADDLMTVHDGCAAVLRERSASTGREISIVMNTLDERLLPPGRADARTEFADPVRLVYHGSITQLYGVHVLVEALARLVSERPVRLTVIGDGDERPRLVDQAEHAGLAGRVEFSDGYLPIERTLARVAESDVGVVPLVGMPINRFSLPSKLFEYVALGLPVVCSRTETIARHFSDEELTYVTPGDASDLARGLLEVLNDPAAAHEKACRARARYDAYRWDVSRARFLELLQREPSARTAEPPRSSGATAPG